MFCRKILCELRYSSGAKEVVSSADFGNGIIPTLNERLSCNGKELTLEDCKRENKGLYSCIEKDVAAVVCQGKAQCGITI